MNHLFGGVNALGWVAIKALLLYVTAVIGFRLGERRTLAEMSAFDFVAAVAVGAIVGRVPNSSTTSYLAGAVTLVTVLVAHRIISRLRQFPGAAALFDHPPRVLVQDGRLLHKELRRSGLTQDDLYGLLRQHGIVDLNQVQYVIFEQRGKISVIQHGSSRGHESQLLRDIAERTSNS
jgi:uncharacterized membrane protein YcaP (DUF421 family)